jgi:hypothetical protein
MQLAHERVLCEALRVKPKLQWRPQDVVDVRNMKLFPRKAIGNKFSQPKREATWADYDKAIWKKLPKLFCSQVMLLHCLDAHHGFTGFYVCPDEFLSCFHPISSFFSPFSSV